ncbi:MAG: UPF0182 family protein [Acidobacteria bacterium]|nr:UPF0182 family protein [Acidobacteriota bacterium]
MADQEFPGFPRLSRGGESRKQGRWVLLVVLLLVVIASARTVARYVIEYQWWREMEQVPTWISILLYSILPVTAAALVAFATVWVAHARSLRFVGTRLGAHRMYARISTLVLLLIGIVVAAGTIDTWTVMRYLGGRSLPAEASAWHDPVFNQPLGFYLFDLPFYRLLRSYLLGLAIAAAMVYWLTARGWQLKDKIAELQQEGQLDVSLLRLEGALESRFLRGVGAVLLLAVAFRFFLGRYEMVWNDHGFMVGIDWVDLNVALPLQWLVIVACLAAALLLGLGRWKLAAAMALALVLRAGLPPAVNAIYVRPNEISIQRNFIDTHIKATRAAYGLEGRVREMDSEAKLDGRFDPAQHRALFDNVRLWDWRAFHDTVTQIQALRPYYRFADTDVDRYVIDGQLRQVMLTPRELDIRQLPDARARWINPHFIYTHGYGMVMAEANRITADGLPHLFVQDAPPVVRTASLKLTRPEIYYGEVVHEPVFVRTELPEFNYPSGAENIFSRYEGRGGFPASSWPVRIAAALAQGDFNILLTGYLKPDSRMMIRRHVRQRLQALARFITWEEDPYLVLTDQGRLVWTVDGYTTSAAHPYSYRLSLAGAGVLNYMRNAVKATVDAYDGTVHIYIFDPADPIIRAYQRLFPQLFQPASAMPPDLRAHARYPDRYFRVQAEIYRTFHMRDPQAFYNKEDLWDLPRTTQGTTGRPQELAPAYVVASLPGEDQAEFMLIIPFTPRNKDNMIGLMVARCDGDKLGEMVVLQLSKQELMFGSMQIEARINQDQNIAKDLTLWNQQGSQVLRGQMLVLPVANTFVYVQPIYIQAAEARMPQLKKVALAVGNDLIYTDTYDQALDELARLMRGAAPPAAKPGVAAAPAAGTPSPAATAALEQRIESIRQHLRRYRDLAAQGKWAEAGKVLEALEAEAQRR